MLNTDEERRRLMASELHTKYNAQVARKELVLSHCKLLWWGKDRKNIDI